MKVHNPKDVTLTRFSGYDLCSESAIIDEMKWKCLKT